MAPLPDELLTTSEISALFKVNRVTVTQWIHAGKLQAIRTLGGYHRVPRENLIQFLKSNNMPVPRLLRSGQAVIVAADDDADFLKLLGKKIMSGLPESRLETADNGPRALIKVGELKPDVLILDIVMPDMDGIEVIRRIRQDPGLAGMKIIAMSGHSGKEQAALAAGADVFFSKRANLQDLLARLVVYLSASGRG